ncbi:antibiotic biosynthesis monooxygenase [Desulfovibrionales bacterium]
MIFVLFEVVIAEHAMPAYLKLAASLKNELEQAPGYIRSERFQSLTTERKLLSLSIWQNEEAVEKWRTALNHRLSQRQGRDTLFESYTLTVASKIRSYTKTARAEAPRDAAVLLPTGTQHEKDTKDA